MEHKYKKGELVYESIYPSRKLIISNFANGIYYCKAQENRTRKDLVYFERDLRRISTAAENS